jgi:hypothetical protein
MVTRALLSRSRPGRAVSFLGIYVLNFRYSIPVDEGSRHQQQETEYHRTEEDANNYSNQLCGACVFKTGIAIFVTVPRRLFFTALQ